MTLNRTRSRQALSALLLVSAAMVQAAGAGAATGARPSAALGGAEAATSGLVLGPGDVLRLQVIGRPEMSTQLYVADDGSIPVPMSGAVTVSGLSPAAAAERVAAALKRDRILLQPQVSLVLEQMRSQRISVVGQVRTAGRFPVDSRTTLIDALAQAGGTTDLAADTAYILRTDRSGSVQRIEVDLGALVRGSATAGEMLLRPGDSVVVPEADRFYIFGEVRAPNMYRLERGMTVVQAISRGGGLTLYGSERRIEIERHDASGASARISAKLADRIQAGDVIRVKERLF